MDQALTLLAFLQSPAPQVICRHRRIVECNHAFAHLFGYRRENLVGGSTRVLYPSLADYHEIGQRFLKLLQRSCYYEDERFMQHQSHEIFWTRSRGVTLTPDDPLALVVWNFERITDAAKTVYLTQREREISSYVLTSSPC